MSPEQDKQAQELNQMSDQQPKVPKNEATKVLVSRETEVKKLGFKVKSTLVWSERLSDYVLSENYWQDQSGIYWDFVFSVSWEGEISAKTYLSVMSVYSYV